MNKYIVLFTVIEFLDKRINGTKRYFAYDNL